MSRLRRGRFDVSLVACKGRREFSLTKHSPERPNATAPAHRSAAGSPRMGCPRIRAQPPGPRAGRSRQPSHHVRGRTSIDLRPRGVWTKRNARVLLDSGDHWRVASPERHSSDEGFTAAKQKRPRIECPLRKRARKAGAPFRGQALFLERPTPRDALDRRSRRA